MNDKIVQMKLTDIYPYERNPRFNDASVDNVANSIREFGFRVPIIVDKNHVIIAGHTRYKAAQKLGMEKVPVMVAEDLTPKQVEAYRLADNKVGENSLGIMTSSTGSSKSWLTSTWRSSDSTHRDSSGRTSNLSPGRKERSRLPSSSSGARAVGRSRRGISSRLWTNENLSQQLGEWRKSVLLSADSTERERERESLPISIGTGGEAEVRPAHPAKRERD